VASFADDPLVAAMPLSLYIRTTIAMSRRRNWLMGKNRQLIPGLIDGLVLSSVF
jgi:hypothetical protein